MCKKSLLWGGKCSLDLKGLTSVTSTLERKDTNKKGKPYKLVGTFEAP